MTKLLYVFISLVMLISLLANPVPVTMELADMVLIVLPLLLFGFTLYFIPQYKMYSIEIDLFIAIVFYILYLIISILMGLFNDIGFLDVLRSVGPYINFAPLLTIAIFPQRLNITYLAIILIVVGMLQAFYLFFLYCTHAINAQNTLHVLIDRITLLDAHTTLPWVLALVTLPLSFMTNKNKVIKLLAAGLFLIGLIASASTLTRSLIIASLLGVFIFFLLYVYQNAKQFKIQVSYYFFKIIPGIFYFIVIYYFLLTIPQFHNLVQGLNARFLNNMAGSADYSNGRLFDEWLPALRKWANNDVLGWFFGMGAGHTFTVTGGENRAYIHNLSIYSLVYGGFFGLFSCLWLYLTVFRTLIIRAYQTQETVYLAFAALLISIFTYGQFFAVHKGLAFNAMFYMIIAIALMQPRLKQGQCTHVRN